jgi:S1-C subfamily serine protease
LTDEPADKNDEPGVADDPGAPGEQYVRTLLLRADHAFADRSVAAAVLKVRAIIGVPQIPEAEVAAQAAWDKLRAAKRPSATELAALELVIRLMRPAPLSKGGDLEPLPSAPGSSTYNPATVAAWDGFRAKAKPLLYSIGRLDRATGSDPSVGTGFLVAPDLVLTNRHVIGQLSMGAEALDPGQAVITFNQEADCVDPTPSKFAVKRIVALHPRLDLALLHVELPEPRRVLEFEKDPVALATEVAAIGYPFKDGRNPLFVSAIYGSRYGVKRAALGQVTGESEGLIFHDCSTLGGSSGSPLLSLATCRIVGVHYTGQFMYRNEAVVAAEAASFVAEAVQ